MLKRTSLLIILIFLISLSLTAVCGQDNADFEEIQQSDLELTELEQNTDMDVLSESEVGTFSDLNSLIQSSINEVNLTKDYRYVRGDSVSSSGISISKSLTINGNNRTIDGSNLHCIFYVSASNVVLKDINIVNAYDTGVGGAVYSTGSYFKVINCTFNNTYSGLGALYIGGTGSSVINSTFVDNTATGATAIYWYGSSGTLKGSTFENNVATGDSAGAVFWQGNYGTVIDSTFINNTAKKKNGGAIYWYGRYGNVLNSTFCNNTVETTIGGAIYWGGFYGALSGSKFINNTAVNDLGGGAVILGHSVNVMDSYFEGNSANTRGGGLYYNARSGNLNNLTFVKNHAYMAGGAFLGYDYYENTDIDRSYATLSNSRFVNNTAEYGGGAVDAISYFTIQNSEFIGNTAKNYGGAVSMAYSSLINSTFTNNSAYFGGGVYTYNSNIADSTFINNNAQYGNSIYVINTSSLSNNVLDDEVYNKTAIPGGLVVGSHEINHMLHTSDGYMGYCSELHNGKPYSGEYDHSMELLRNVHNGESVSEYLKILIYTYFDHMQDLRDHDFHDYVWWFTDRTYWNSTDPIVKEVISLYDSGFRVPNVNACKVLANGTLMYLNFSSLITPSSQQNLFLFKHAYGDVINETLTKEALNKTAFVGDDVEYRIVVSNKGTSPIYDLWVEDKDYSSGLMYESWESEIGNWTYNNQTAHWILNELLPGKSASIILTFRVMVNGTLYNNATSGIGNKNITNSTNTTVVYNPNFTVSKIVLNKTVELGNQVIFEILIHNTGDIPLNDIFVEEFSYGGLVYDSWSENLDWTYKNVNGKHRWYYDEVLSVGEYQAFRVIFNTTAYGNFTNVAVVSSNETENKTANNTTKVLKPDFEVYKNVLTPYVVVGNQTIFEIVVKNTGEVDLDDIVVIEDKYDGLIYNDTVTGDKWTHKFVNGKHTWKMNDVLKKGTEEYFFVIFNTVRVGNFTNYVIAASNKTGNKTTNNTTIVNETVNETGNNSNFSVIKITVNELVAIGDLVEFQIIVKNTGDTLLHNLTVYEHDYEGLVYYDYIDHFGFWNFDEDDMSWTLDSIFYPGEELGFHVLFNTTQYGNFTNVIMVSSNETDNKTANNTTRVVKPGVSIEKITINRTVIVGSQTTFEIVVFNVGEEVLNDVVVREIDYEGLIYDHFTDYTGLWTKNEDLSWTLNRELGIGEYEGFYITFNTTKKGNFTNIVCVNDNSTDNDTVEVLDYNFTVSKIALNKIVIIGQQTTFEILVTNTGDLDLDDLVVIEKSYDGLIYDSWIENSNWQHYVQDNLNKWKLNTVLAVGQTLSFDVIFNTTKKGNFTNVAVALSNKTDNKTTNNTTEVLNSDFEVIKNVLTPKVILGNEAIFEIIVKNTGDVDLDDIVVLEESYDGLIYSSWNENGQWIHRVIDDKHSWILNTTLHVNDSLNFTVSFKTIKSGNFTNVVSSSNKSANNTTEVLRPDFKILKNVLTPKVVLGNQATFEIVVINTGETELHDVFIIESDYDGLIYDSWRENDRWSHSVVDNQHRWDLITSLAVGEISVFSVTFNTTAKGNFTNVVIGGSNETDNVTSENTTEVLGPDFEVYKDVLTPKVELGSQVKFEIIVKNTGEADLTDICVIEDSYDGLIYDSWNENSYWTHSIVNGKHQWNLNNILSVNEVISFEVVFNTTKSGNFTNYVVAKSNQTGNKTANNTTEVSKSDFKLIKNVLTPYIHVGDQAIFEIVLINTGEVPLDYIVVYEDKFDGLTFNSTITGDFWSYSFSNEKHMWKLNTIVKPKEEIYFFVVFDTSEEGNFTNYAVATSNKTDNKTANNTVVVNKTIEEFDKVSNFTVQKVTLTPSVIIGDIVEFEIVVKNTGDTILPLLTIFEQEIDGLIYNGYIDHFGYWSFDDKEFSWTLNCPFYPNEELSITLLYNTTLQGNFTNYITAEVPGFENKTSNDTVEVLKPKFAVNKIAINKTAIIGDSVIFEILVRNVGEVPLTNLTVFETNYDGLIYDSFVDYSNVWIKNQDLSWTLNKQLEIGDFEELFLIFKVTEVGNFTNVVVAGAPGCDNQSSNDTVEVLQPSFDVSKVALNSTVLVGEKVIFEITVFNSGKVVLDNVTVFEDDFEGLVYDSFIDYSHVWVKNSDMSWTLNHKLNVGEYVALFIVFNTTKKGNFTNVVVACASGCDYESSNDTVEVMVANLTVLKLTLNNTVTLGNLTGFEIIVTNTGDIDLDNVFVCENDYGLGIQYLTYESLVLNWNHQVNNEGKHVFILQDTLKTGDSASFKVIFKTLSVGNYSNTVVAGFNNHTIDNSTNMTEIVNNTVPKDNKTNKTTPGDNITNKTKPVPDNNKTDEFKRIQKTVVDKNATGNPILLFLLTIILLPLRRFKK